MKEFLISFTPKFHIYVPHPNLTWFLSLNNNPSHIYHLVSPFSPPTLLDRFVPHISLVCQLIVMKSTGSSGVWVTGNLAFEIAVHFVIIGSFGPGGSSSVVVVVHLMLECMGYSDEHFVFDDHHPCPLLYFYKWAIWSPSTLLLYLLWCYSGTGDCHFLGLSFNVYCGSGCRNRGNWPVLS